MNAGLENLQVRVAGQFNTVDELRKLPGVGLLVAMTFLTEMGDLERFHNRREMAAYLGLCPSSFESGETNDRKGRIDALVDSIFLAPASGVKVERRSNF